LALQVLNPHLSSWYDKLKKVEKEREIYIMNVMNIEIDSLLNSRNVQGQRCVDLKE